MFQLIEGSVPLWFKLFLLFIYVLVLAIGISRLHSDSGINRFHRNVLLIVFIIWCVYYCISGDYFQYQEWVTLKYDRDTWFKEQLYLYLIRFSRFISMQYAYDVFRLIIFGGGLIIFCALSSNVKESYISLLLLFLVFNNVFAYARASLAMSVYFGGVCVLSSDKVFIRLLGIPIIVSSLFFHAEMIIAILLTPIVFAPIERIKNYLFIILIIVFACLVFERISSFVMVFDGLSDSGQTYTEKIDSYNSEITSGRWGSQSVGHLIGYSLFFISFFVITKVLRTSYSEVPRRINYLYRITFAILSVSIVFAIVFGFGTVYFYRVLNISIIPISLLLAFFFQNRKISLRSIDIILLYAAIYQIIKLILRVLES